MYFKFLIFSAKENTAFRHIVYLYVIIIIFKKELFILEKVVATLGQLCLFCLPGTNSDLIAGGRLCHPVSLSCGALKTCKWVRNARDNPF